MASLRETLAVHPWWVATYKRYGLSDPSNKYYGHYPQSALNGPLVVDSNRVYSVELNRYWDGVPHTYNIGAVDPDVARSGMGRKLHRCAMATANPDRCAHAILGNKVECYGCNSRYDRMGQEDVHTRFSC
jgi:hypothetical protein